MNTAFKFNTINENQYPLINQLNQMELNDVHNIIGLIHDEYPIGSVVLRISAACQDLGIRINEKQHRFLISVI